MRADHYFDLEVRRGTDLNVPEAMSLALRILHGSGKQFALALPDMNDGSLGEKMRVFGATTVDLEHIQDYMENGPLDDYVAIRRVKAVPETNTFESFHKLNVKAFDSRNSRRIKRGKAAYKENEIEDIHKKNEALNKVNFLTVTSRSNGNKFKLFIVRKSEFAATGAMPNNYGLSSLNNVVALPVFP